MDDDTEVPVSGEVDRGSVVGSGVSVQQLCDGIGGSPRLIDWDSGGGAPRASDRHSDDHCVEERSHRRRGPGHRDGHRSGGSSTRLPPGRFRRPGPPAHRAYAGLAPRPDDRLCAAKAYRRRRRVFFLTSGCTCGQ